MDQNTQQTGNEPVVGDAAQQNAPQPETPSAPAAPAAPAESDAERGLRQAAEAERKKRQDLEAQLTQSQMLINQLANQIRQPQQQVQQPVAEPDPLGLSDQDLLDPAKIRQGLLKVRQEAIAAAQKSVAELQFKIQYPDFTQLVGTTNPATGQFIPSEIMQEAFTDDPTLQPTLLQMGPAAPLAAYKIALQQKRLRELRQAATANTAQASAQQAQARSAMNTADARTAPMSPSAVSGPPAQVTEADLDTLLKNPKMLDEIVQSISRGKYG